MQSHHAISSQVVWNIARIFLLPISISIALTQVAVSYFKRATNINTENKNALLQQTPLYLDKHRTTPQLSTVFFFLFILSPTLAKNSQTKKEDFVKLIKERTIIDPSVVSLTDKDQCEEQLQEAIIAMMDPETLSAPTIHRLFADKKFKFRCSTKKAINDEFNRREGFTHDADKKTNVTAYFDPKFLEIAFSPITDRQVLRGELFHESLHAENHILAHTKNCLQSHAPISPVFPVTLKKIDEYTQAFYIGYKRIEEFGLLRTKNLNNEILTIEEKQLFQTYSKAAEKYPLVSGLFKFPSAQYKEIANKLKTLSSGEIHTITNRHKIRFKVLEIQPPNSVLLEPMSGEEALLELPSKIKTVLQQFNHPSKSLEDYIEEVDERQSHTLQYLPKRTAQVFFKEVLALRKQYIQRCLPDSPETAQMTKMEL